MSTSTEPCEHRPKVVKGRCYNCLKADPEAYAAYQLKRRAWAYRNPELKLKSERESYERNRAKRIAKATRWRKANLDRHAANERARRAKAAGLFVEYVHPLVVLEIADGVCGICGEDVDPREFQVDHIEPQSLGGEHSYLNTQPAHPRCNVSKGNRAA